jgi:hypothetical protein
LENRKKAGADFPRIALKRMNRVEERASCLRMNREQDNTNVRAHKMMRGRMEPSTVPIVVRAVPTLVGIVKQIATIPQMTSPQERQLKEQRQDIP